MLQINILTIIVYKMTFHTFCNAFKGMLIKYNFNCKYLSNPSNSVFLMITEENDRIVAASVTL